ncbi:MAG: hypothetical protein MUC95_07785 [Spirochaetes bacterium]|nr:hypothetical protein [Spirochaetota bacterium]
MPGGGKITISRGAGSSVAVEFDDEQIIFDQCNYNILMWIDSNDNFSPDIGDMISKKATVQISTIADRTVTFNIAEFIAYPVSIK